MCPLKIDSENLWRERILSPFLKKEPFLSFFSNDYFSLSKHPEVIHFVKNSVEETGLGSTGSPLLSGYSKSHRFIETLFCEKLGFEDALLFPSGYQANVSVLSAFLNTKSVVLADRFIHASVVDGIQLGKAKLVRCAHNDMEHFVCLRSNICLCAPHPRVASMHALCIQIVWRHKQHRQTQGYINQHETNILQNHDGLWQTFATFTVID